MFGNLHNDFAFMPLFSFFWPPDYGARDGQRGPLTLDSGGGEIGQLRR